MIKLTKISLVGYKSIRECRNLELGNLNVLIGANGVGKSNFLSFFKLLNFVMTGAFQEFVGRGGGARSIIHFGPKVTPQLSVKLEMSADNGTNVYDALFSYALPDTLLFAGETISFLPTQPDKKQTPWVLGGGHRETALRDPENMQNSKAKIFRAALTRFRFYQFHDTSDESRLRGRSHIDDDARYLLSNGGHTAAILRAIRDNDPARYQRIVKTIQIVAPFFGDFILEPDVPGGKYVMLRWRAEGRSEYEFGPHQLSDGTLRFIALTTLLLQPKSWLPALIVLDEPELGLHPAALDLLAGLLAEVSSDTQIIVSTQSSAFLDSFTPEDVIVVERKDDASELKRLKSSDLQEWLSEYSLGDLVRKNVIESGPQYA